jgi:hypothetical protein
MPYNALNPLTNTCLRKVSPGLQLRFLHLFSRLRRVSHSRLSLYLMPTWLDYIEIWRISRPQESLDLMNIIHLSLGFVSVRRSLILLYIDVVVPSFDDLGERNDLILNNDLAISVSVNLSFFSLSH